MKKEDIISKLTAAGVSIPEGATVAILTALAETHGVSLKDEGNSSSGEGQDVTPAAAASTAPASPGVEDPVFAEARAEVAAMTPKPTPKGVTEEQIAAKMAAGLTRSQAVEVLERQLDWDARNPD